VAKKAEYKGSLDNTTPLHLAAKNGHTHIIKQMIKMYGSIIDINETNDAGMTAHCFASYKGHLDTLIVIPYLFNLI
jgi:ankyrin repeat protein